MPTLQNHGPTRPTAAHVTEQQQRRRMVIALLVLLLALILVLVKDRQMLFSPSSPDSEAETVVPQTAAPVIEQQSSVPSSPVPSRRSTHPRAMRQAIVAKALPGLRASAPSLVLASSRAVLPSLEVEVIAGNQRHSLDAATSSVNVRLQDGITSVPSESQTQAARTGTGDAVERVQLSPGTSQVVDTSVEPSYPRLAKQMKVQGAVILETLISKSGTIEDIQVLSGPAILSAAAREAVRQWRFKPYLKAGQPVDSQARVTVNFTISTY